MAILAAISTFAIINLMHVPETSSAALECPSHSGRLWPMFVRDEGRLSNRRHD